MPGLLYLLGYLVVVPLVVYFPTHLLLQWWATWRLSAGRRKEKIVKSPRFHQPFSVSEIADFNNYFQ
jgi:hypothetical protein